MWSVSRFPPVPFGCVSVTLKSVTDKMQARPQASHSHSSHHLRNGESVGRQLSLGARRSTEQYRRLNFQIGLVGKPLNLAPFAARNFLSQTPQPAEELCQGHNALVHNQD